MGELPHLKALVERHKNAPFALIGLNSGDSETAFLEGLEKREVTWPCIWQGPADEIKSLYRVPGFPTVYVLDGEGKIRFTNLRGMQLERAVDKLVEETRKASH